MSLRRKMGVQIAAMIVGLLGVCAMAMWGMDAVREDFGLAAIGYRQLRDVYEVGSHLKIAHALLSPGHVDRGRALAEVEVAATKFDLLARAHTPNGAPAPSQAVSDADVGAALSAALAQLRTPPEAQTDAADVIAADDQAVARALGTIGNLASAVQQTVSAHQDSANRKHARARLAVAVVSGAVVLAAVLLGVAQYRGVVGPLGALRAGVRRVAAGHFAQRLAPRGGEEFVELAGEFNRMAAELDGFYNQLEQRVAQKSKELIRSERLASVGYLAAGVAHEINNPLGIIAGYAEFSLEQLKRDAKPANENATGRTTSNGDGDALARSLQVICDEAFRCKDITGKLLSLARQGDEEPRRPVCLADVAERVASIVGGLREHRGRRLAVIAPRDAAGRAELSVSAVEAEMQQVVLNLTLNALEATAPANGEVRIEVARRGEDTVELSVADNGRGMKPQTLDRIFEPFFTDKRGCADARGSTSHGTGLGLSITHAIIASHGGSIAAHSDGPGTGSRFTVALPAAIPLETG